MEKVKSIILKVVIVVFAFSLIFISINYYPYIFAKTVKGEVVGLKYLSDKMAIVDNGSQVTSKAFSFAVGIKDLKTGEIFTSSSEDRQWGAVKEGQCASAKFFPYPPWKFDKDGTYFNARLEQLFENCDSLKE